LLTACRVVLALSADVCAPECETKEIGAPRVVGTTMPFLRRQFAARINLAFEPGHEGRPSMLGEFATIVGGVELVSADAPEKSSATLTGHTDTDLRVPARCALTTGGRGP
jgi:hypothetical protein